MMAEPAESIYDLFIGLSLERASGLEEWLEDWRAAWLLLMITAFFRQKSGLLSFWYQPRSSSTTRDDLF